MEPIIIKSRARVVKYELPYEDPIRDPQSAKLQRQHMANDFVQLTVHTTETMPLEIGDWIEVRGCRYSIRAQSDITRAGEDNFTYNIQFYGAMYNLMRYRFRNVGVTTTSQRSAQNTFDLTLTLKGFINVIVNNVIRAEGITAADIATQSPWLFDEANCHDTDPITMSFDKQNCLTVLQSVCEQFDVEFRITQQLNETTGVWQSTIHAGEFGDVVNNTPFEYGEGNGLYQLQETKVDDSCIVNRLWAEGSTENILSGYRGYSMRLQLPRKNVALMGSGATRRYTRNQHTIEIDGEKYIFKEGFPIGIDDDEIRSVDETNLYAGTNDPAHGWWKKEGEENWKYAPFNPSGLINKYGVLEDSQVFDDVKPSPTFVIYKPYSGDTRKRFFCSIGFDLGAIWQDNPSDFLEWCLLKTQLTPTEAQYNACKNVYDNQDEGDTFEQDAELWPAYRVSIGEGLITSTTSPYVLWRQQHHSASAPTLPALPADYDTEIYSEYCIFREYLVSATNSKYLIDGGQMAMIDGKCAGIAFDINGDTSGYKFYDELTAAEKNDFKFSSSKYYSAGEYCLRVVAGENRVYRFKADHPAGSWINTDADYVGKDNFSLITINVHTEENTQCEFPSEDEFGAFRIKAGDQFKLTSIYFPYSYYEDAEEELWFAAWEKFEAIKFPSVRYKLSFDQMFVDENKTLFEAILPGDYISITDGRFGITNKKMRVTQVDCNILNNTEYQITLESVRKQRTRTGINYRDIEDVWMAMRDVSLDDPFYRRNNRTSGNRAMSFITANGAIRADRVADNFIAERMIANLAVTTDKLFGLAVTAEKIATGAVESGKIADLAITTAKLAATAVTEAKLAAGAVTSTKLASNAVTLEKLDNATRNKVNIIPALQRFANAGDIADRHFEGGAAAIDASNLFKIPAGMKIIDSLSKARLGYSVNAWASSNDAIINFEDGNYEDGKAYYIYAKLESDGTCSYAPVVSGIEADDVMLKIGSVSAKDGDGKRTYTSEIGQTYLEGGVLKNAGTTILDLKNGIIRGDLKFSGLKGSNNNDIDLVSLLGTLPTTAGGMRKLLSDAVGTIGDDVTIGTLLYRAATLESHVGEDDQDTGGLLYRAAQLESGRSTHMGKINELIDSAYSANQILLSIQSNFNTMRSQLLNRKLINQSSDSGTVSELGISHCTWNPIQQTEQCSIDPQGIGIPTRLQN